MSDLKDRIRHIIKANGPLTVDHFMTMALADPDAGYYQTEPPFGLDGDFITAPDISQMFGELIGIWVVSTWQMLGAPETFILSEMGPGRGTLMDDVLRTLQKLSPQCFESAHIFMVETSDRLTCEQKQRLAHHSCKIEWVTTFDQIANGPLILIANELLDAIPIQQFVKHNNKWHERLISLDDDNGFMFIIGEHTLDDQNLPTKYKNLEDESILEVAPLRNQLVELVAKRLANTRGCALLIDYGAGDLPYGDTLQAMSKHEYRDIFDAPGLHDLTSHVDFTSLQAVAQKQNCLAAILPQGEFLLNMGLVERAGQLSANKNADVQERLRSEVERLASPQHMGQLFKVLALSDQKTGLHPVFSTPH